MSLSEEEKTTADLIFAGQPLTAAEILRPKKKLSYAERYNGKINLDMAYRLHFEPVNGEQSISIPDLARMCGVSRQFMYKVLIRMREERLAAEEFALQRRFRLANLQEATLRVLEERLKTKTLADTEFKELAQYYEIMSRAEVNFVKQEMEPTKPSQERNFDSALAITRAALAASVPEKPAEPAQTDPRLL